MIWLLVAHSKFCPDVYIVVKQSFNKLVPVGNNPKRCKFLECHSSSVLWKYIQLLSRLALLGFISNWSIDGYGILV